MSSSAVVHGSLRMAGSSWLCHLSRHCLPVRPLSDAPMTPQCFVPCVWTCEIGREMVLRAEEEIGLVATFLF